MGAGGRGVDHGPVEQRAGGGRAPRRAKIVPVGPIAAGGPGGVQVLLPEGTGVEVRNRFDATWSPGFEVVDHVDGGYRVLRCSDGTVLPRTFTSDEVRRTRKGSPMWWI